MTEHRGVLLERDTKTHRSRVVEVPASVLAEDDEEISNVRAPSSVARVDFAGMARRRRQEVERHGL